MLLAIDSGNTNVIFAIFDGEELRTRWRISKDLHRTADEYAVWLTQLIALEGLALEDIKAVVISNVVPASQHYFSTLCHRYLKCEPLVVGAAEVDLGIETFTDRPAEVGADRLVNAVAVHDRYKGPAIVVDLGTATTFDVVDGKGNYTGGVIAPGINLSLEALYMEAAKLPRIALEKPEKIIGTGTISAMQSGIFWGYVSMIEGMVTRIVQEFGEPMTVVATGGLAALFADSTDAIQHHDPELTLRGLLKIHQINSPS
jgi:type III pantothenate kinase